MDPSPTSRPAAPAPRAAVVRPAAPPASEPRTAPLHGFATDRPPTRRSRRRARGTVLVVGLALWVGSACGSGADRPAGRGTGGSDGAERSGRVDADRPPVLGGLPLSLPEDAWTGLPAVLSVRQARRVGDGWVLLDGRARALHLLADGAPAVRTVAREGDGPGELRLPEALAVVGDTVWVARVGADRLDAFRADGSFLRGVTTGGAACPGGLLHGMAAAPDGSLLLAVQCIAPGGLRRLLGRIDPWDGTASWRPWPGAPASDDVLSLDRLVVASAHGDVLVGRSGRRCLMRMASRTGTSDPPEGAGPAAADSLCVDGTRRVPLSAALQDTLRRAFRARARGLGLDFETPTHEPWLTGAFRAAAGWVAVRPDGRAAVLEPLAPPGSAAAPAARLRLPPDVTPFLDEGHLLLVRTTLEGTDVARVAWPGGVP